MKVSHLLIEFARKHWLFSENPNSLKLELVGISMGLLYQLILNSRAYIFLFLNFFIQNKRNNLIIKYYLFPAIQPVSALHKGQQHTNMCRKQQIQASSNHLWEAEGLAEPQRCTVAPPHSHAGSDKWMSACFPLGWQIVLVGVVGSWRGTDRWLREEALQHSPPQSACTLQWTPAAAPSEQEKDQWLMNDTPVWRKPMVAIVLTISLCVFPLLDRYIIFCWSND